MEERMRWNQSHIKIKQNRNKLKNFLCGYRFIHTDIVIVWSGRLFEHTQCVPVQYAITIIEHNALCMANSNSRTNQQTTKHSPNSIRTILTLVPFERWTSCICDGSFVIAISI